jgi:phage terminase small subunit
MSLTEQQERFCQLIIQGNNQTEAYREAGYKGSGKQLGDNASRLIANDRVQARIAELRQEAVEMAQIDLQWLINESVELYQLAKKEGAHGAANATLKTIGVYTGLWDEKSTRQNINRTVDEYTDAELASYLTGSSGGRTAEQTQSPAKPH